jgi:Glycosyl transferases group 1
VTRHSMAESGWCPSGRLFEAAACATPILSDWWEGLDAFFAPDSEILVVHSTAEVLAELDRDDGELRRIGEAGRARALSEHTAERRAAELIHLLSNRSPAGLQPTDLILGESRDPHLGNLCGGPMESGWSLSSGRPRPDPWTGTTE